MDAYKYQTPPRQLEAWSTRISDMPPLGPILIKSAAWIMIATLTTSCCTDLLWRNHDPHNTIEVSYDEMTEVALIEDGFIYTKDDAKQLYFIEPSPTKQRFATTTRIILTPLAVTADAFTIFFFALGGVTPPLSMDELEKYPVGQP